MGIVRSQPDTNILMDIEYNQKWAVVTGKVSGWQVFMEDFTFSFQYSEHVYVMGILDGQNGPEIAQFCHNQIEQIIRNCELMKLQQYQAAIENLCFTLQQRINENNDKINYIRSKYNLPQLPQSDHTPSQTSLIMCIIDEQSITISNLGQCKCYVSYKYSEQKAVLISGNHVIDRDADKDRIEQKGGFVIDGLVNGKQVLTKVIGNLKYKDLQNPSKSIISSEPSVFSLRLDDLNYVVMGSSGLWQRPQIVVKEIIGKKMTADQLKVTVQNLISTMIAQDSSNQYGKQNITIKVLKINERLSVTK